MRPVQPPWGRCDWGDCDLDAVSWGWSAECDQWLPVCHDHQESPVTAVDRCSARYLDASTPSGWTRCMLDEGHGGPHEHVNMTRRIGWRPLAPNDGSRA